MMLEESYIREEIVEALKHMHPTKVVLDGMCALFSDFLEYS